ncbi:MAG: 4Fe-4S dicluster domain-containing protein [Desulfopila sp.]|jgi:Fe-S oxidoreductase|nr:4Fe-4S dicluster domain-containing protein [Desulfopila sp.]
MCETNSTQPEIKVATGDRAILPEGAKTIPIFVMGKKYEVPETLTIMKAMEFAGFKFLRGAGCRGGICGACPTVYRLAGDYKLHFGLACQTVVEPNMYLAQIPFFPANRASFNIEELNGAAEAIHALYPEVFRCVACNLCTKACPMDVKVMDYISAIKQGQIEKAARISFDCIQCGLCSSRCMGEIPQYHVAQLARRIFARYIQPQAEHLKQRAEEISAGKYDQMLDDLSTMDKDNLEQLYVAREREPDMAEPGTWQPQDTKHL